MAIHMPQGPADGKDVVHRALNHLSIDALSAQASLGGGTAQKPNESGLFRTYKPIPIFRVDLDSIRDISFLSEARPIGWRYLVDRDGPVAVADVRETSSGGVTFSRVTRGLPAKRLLMAAQLAEDTYGKVAGDYELRILDIPALHRSALWLHLGNSHQLAQKRDVFILIMSSRPQGEEVQEDSSLFLEEVVCAANAYRHWIVAQKAPSNVEPEKVIEALWPKTFPEAVLQLRSGLQSFDFIEPRIRQLAYAMWENSVWNPQGAGDFWLAAEKHVLILTSAVICSPSASAKGADALAPMLSVLSGATHLQLIERFAHSIWEQTGRQYGFALDHWLAAEKQVLAVSVAVVESSSDAQQATRSLPSALESLDPMKIMEPIRALAGAMWEQAGRQPGLALDFWVAAERHVLTLTVATIRQASAGSKSADVVANTFAAFSPIRFLETISKVAQRRWQELGRQTSRNFDLWLNAEREILAAMAAGKVFGIADGKETAADQRAA